jgi:hypothetical protein
MTSDDFIGPLLVLLGAIGAAAGFDDLKNDGIFMFMNPPPFILRVLLQFAAFKINLCLVLCFVLLCIRLSYCASLISHDIKINKHLTSIFNVIKSSNRQSKGCR